MPIVLYVFIFFFFKFFYRCPIIYAIYYIDLSKLLMAYQTLIMPIFKYTLKISDNYLNFCKINNVG